MSQPAEQFAKLFETEHGQVVVMRREGDEGPEVRLYAMPEGLGVCEMAFGFKATDAGHDLADKSFAEFDQAKAVDAVKTVFLMSSTGAA